MSGKAGGLFLEPPKAAEDSAALAHFSSEGTRRQKMRTAEEVSRQERKGRQGGMAPRCGFVSRGGAEAQRKRP